MSPGKEPHEGRLSAQVQATPFSRVKISLSMLPSRCPRTGRKGAFRCERSLQIESRGQSQSSKNRMGLRPESGRSTTGSGVQKERETVSSTNPVRTPPPDLSRGAVVRPDHPRLSSRPAHPKVRQERFWARGGSEATRPELWKLLHVRRAP
jgi:hypothetical protein